MLHIISHTIMHTLEDSIRLIPFLFLTYLAMEYLEHKAADKTGRLVKRAGKWGPLFGGVFGAVPQCGFSAAASGLYAGGLVSMGTLLAIFLSTSDEMLPIMISAKLPAGFVAELVLIKVAVGVTAGFLTDILFKEKHKAEHGHIHEICEHEHCHCEKGIFSSAVKHTLQITGFIFLITFVLNMVLECTGEDVLAGIVLNQPILGPLLAGLVGLIPNCASSVVITQLYVEGVIGLGTMMSGLLAGSGIGLLVLFRVNHKKWDNLKILGLLYGIGAAAGIIIELFL